ncbi:hypothetical protein DPMN_115661 [Dreissena polymorpha]|uniref:Bicarbonate transporter-like transmembrane domain-containing protein n=2 Tax=Dreissena polymorpha TaxID=45954 RepID=A0A9D4KM49_DREPO|nr:hypothetical protein DPMN_115661 [Dreissena polymorpha]
MDVKKFLNKTVLLLDVMHVSLDAIIDEILRRLLDLPEYQICFDQARSALFTNDNVHQLTRTLQCTSISEGEGFDHDQSWLCAIASIPSITQRHVGLARLRHPANFGPSSQEVYFVILILTPIKEKGTKSDLETGRTFATIFSNLELRNQLLDCHTEEEFKVVLAKNTQALVDKMSRTDEKDNLIKTETEEKYCWFLGGLIGDFKRRLPHYLSDYKDGVVGPKAVQKTISTTFFLYFACLMPSIAFGVLNSENTQNALNVEKVLYSQSIGGLAFAIFGGTPQIVLLTTAPLALYTKIIFSICEDFDLDFTAMYCCVGLWNTFFLFLYAFFDLSKVMKWSTRSSEEIFAVFISIAFTIDAIKNTVLSFDTYYSSPQCSSDFNATAALFNTNLTSSIDVVCERDISLLYLLLLLGTLWLGVFLFNFTKTPYLNPGKRELLADYALPCAVICMSLIGVFAFKDVKMSKSFDSKRNEDLFSLVELGSLSVGAAFGAMGLGFCLSLLFFMDQNISAALVNAPQNKMKKGSAYHLDLVVIGLINGVLSMFAFPWVHAALPHSPLHVRALADVEERVDQGHIYSIIVKVRETRLTAIFSSILIGLSLLFLSVLSYIPTPVLYGMFLYIAVTALTGNQMFERLLLLITEQSAYPPNHYIRRVPQRMMHFFTLLQLVQLLVLCGFGFAPYPYLKMFFPVIIFILIPIRQKVIPMIVQQKYLHAMDSH